MSPPDLYLISMSVEIIREKYVKFVEGVDIARFRIANFFSTLKILTIIGIPISLIFPPAGIAIATFMLIKFLEEIYNRYFADAEIKAYYQKEFRPKITKTQYLQVGYEIYPSELNQHLKLVDDLLEGTEDQERAIKELSAKAKTFLKQQPYRMVGFSKKMLPTHMWIIGTTGAGKTSFIMQGFLKQFEQGGGVIFVDGKGDMKGFRKFTRLAQKAGRLSDVLCLNFLTASEHKTQTNTYNPFVVFPPAILVEFLGTLIPSEGDQAYWAGRGITLMRSVIYALAFRKKYYNEPFSFETASTYLEPKPYTYLSTMFYAKLIAIEEKLKTDTRIGNIISQAKKLLQPTTDYPNVELITSYLKINPSLRELLEAYGYKVEFIEDLWETINFLALWLGSIAEPWKNAIEKYAKFIYEENKDRVLEMKFAEFLNTLRESERKFERGIGKADRELALWIKSPQQADDQAMQQHAYGKQQWDEPFSVFQQYKHIFGALHSDVDFVDVIQNNKLLYVLLPALPQSDKTTMLLGRIIVMSIRQASSKALGSAIELTPRQAKLVEARITPVPPFLIVLDEYGAYPVEGIDKILAQVRSINLSTWIATQDFTSGRTADQRAENAVLRLWANTNVKVLMKNLDKEIIQLLKEYLPTVKEARHNIHKRDEELYEETSLVIENAPLFEAGTLQHFKNGLSFIIGEGRFGITQILYADEKDETFFHLNRFEPVIF